MTFYSKRTSNPAKRTTNKVSVIT